jgi:mannose-6-phosphate isomerase-like protein (cupin superfamily)
MKKGFKSSIEKETLKNTDFRRVLYTGKKSQLVLMSLKPKEEIGMETHPDVDQFFRFEEGNGKVIIDETEYKVKEGMQLLFLAAQSTM